MVQRNQEIIPMMEEKSMNNKEIVDVSSTQAKNVTPHQSMTRAIVAGGGGLAGRAC